MAKPTMKDIRELKTLYSDRIGEAVKAKLNDVKEEFPEINYEVGKVAVQEALRGSIGELPVGTRIESVDFRSWEKEYRVIIMVPCEKVPGADELKAARERAKSVVTEWSCNEHTRLNDWEVHAAETRVTGEDIPTFNIEQ